MRHFDIEYFKLVRYVVEGGSLSSATHKMFLTQSALSHKLKEIENILGVEVFSRKNRKLQLTEAGHIIHNYASNILEEFREMENALLHVKQTRTERIRIATACFTTYHWLPSVIRKFKDVHPHVSVAVKTETNANALMQLDQDKLDILVTETRPPVTGRYKVDTLFEDQFVLLVSKTSRFAKSAPLRVQDLHHVDLLIFDMDEKSNAAINSYFNPLHIPLNSVTKMQLTEGIIEMVAADLGVTVMPTWIAAPYLKDRRVIGMKLPKRTLKRKWYAVSQRDPEKSHRLLIDVLKTELQRFAG